jgi:hypothetical protein
MSVRETLSSTLSGNRTLIAEITGTGRPASGRPFSHGAIAAVRQLTRVATRAFGCPGVRRARRRQELFNLRLV